MFGVEPLSVYINDPSEKACACVIWMHGLGADAQDMAGLAEQLPLTLAVRHVFIDAPIRPVTINNRMPMRAWYDILGVALTDREDNAGIKASEEIINKVIINQIQDGFKDKQIFLAGFSQGGAMALHTGLNYSATLGGVIALSAYIPLASSCKIALSKDTPMFLASGIYDQIVLPLWTKKSVEMLQVNGFENISSHEYPMEHNICADEVKDIAHWLNMQVSLIKKSYGEK